MGNQERAIKNGQSRKGNQEWTIKKGQSRMDNPETLGTLVHQTQDEDKQNNNTAQKTKQY